MATEKAIVNVSQMVVSLNQGRLMPGGIFRVADHFRDPNDVMRDVQLRKYLTPGIIQIQDIDFDALARAKAQVVVDEQDRAADLAGQAERATAKNVAEEAAQERAKLVAEGRAIEQAEAAKRASQATPVKGDESLDQLFESSRKTRIAAKQAEQARHAEGARQPANKEDRLVEPADLMESRMWDEPAPEPTRDTPVAEAPALAPDDLTDDQLRRVVTTFEVKGAKKMKTRAALLKAVEDLQLDPQDLRRIVNEEE